MYYITLIFDVFKFLSLEAASMLELSFQTNALQKGVEDGVF
jgi:hypothetical protein